jgi:hypothetical protein
MKGGGGFVFGLLPERGKPARPDRRE